MERVVVRRRAVIVEAQDDAREMLVIRSRATEFVVGRWPFEVVLQPAAPADVADDDVQLAVRAEADDAAVVVAAQYREIRIGDVVAVVLERREGG